jgi:hypothetical protein
MRRHYSLAIGICIALACLTLGFLLGQPSAGQAAPALPPEAKPGRYQVAGVQSQQGLCHAILCDTQTGQMWYSDKLGGVWFEWESPVTEKKK